jgi:hypothetical protein
MLFQKEEMMGFKKLPSNSRRLLNMIVSSDNPTELLREMLDKATEKEDEELRGILRELKEEGYISTVWASDSPYHVTIHNKARAYEEQLAETEISERKTGSGNIIIGNKNMITNSAIGNTIQINRENENEKKGFCEKHPIICKILVALAAGVILLFSFWQKIVDFLEGLF